MRTIATTAIAFALAAGGALAAQTHKDKVLLDKAKPGSQVEFAFEQSGSDYVITEIK